jgi:hypothetical protein
MRRRVIRKTIFDRGFFGSRPGKRTRPHPSERSRAHPTEVQFHRRTSSGEFWPTLDGFVSEAEAGHFPLLHFETHGAERRPGVIGASPGLVLASGELITWPKLAPYLTAINEATRLNLIVFMAACHGADVASLIQPLGRALARLLIGPMHTLSVPDLERSTIEFTGGCSVILTRLRTPIPSVLHLDPFQALRCGPLLPNGCFWRF